VLHKHESTAALALKFLILTAGRTKEVLGATWSEMDLASGIWTIPGTRMKAKREHRVPLSAPALTILNTLYQTRLNAFVFPGLRRDKSLGPTTLVALLHRLQVPATIHGFILDLAFGIGPEIKPISRRKFVKRPWPMSLGP
jgi:integrase